MFPLKQDSGSQTSHSYRYCGDDGGRGSDDTEQNDDVGRKEKAPFQSIGSSEFALFPVGGKVNKNASRASGRKATALFFLSLHAFVRQ